MSEERDERLADWLDGRMPAAEQAEFERERATDPELQRDADRYRWTVEHLRAAFAGDGPAPDNLVNAVMAEIDGASRRGHGRLITWAFGAIAAVAATTLVILNLPERERPASEPPIASAPADLRRFDDTAERKKAAKDREIGPATPPQISVRDKAEDAGDAGVRLQRARSGIQPEQERAASEVLRAVQQELARQLPASDYAEPIQTEARASQQPASQQIVFLATIDAPTLDGLWKMRDPRSVVGNFDAGAGFDLPQVLTTPELLGRDNAILGLQFAAVPPSELAPPEGQPARAGAKSEATATPQYVPEPTDQVFRVTGTAAELPTYFARLKQQLTAKGQRLDIQTAPATSLPGVRSSTGVTEESKSARLGDNSADQQAARASVLLIVRTPPAKR